MPHDTGWLPVGPKGRRALADLVGVAAPAWRLSDVCLQRAALRFTLQAGSLALPVEFIPLRSQTPTADVFLHSPRLGLRVLLAPDRRSPAHTNLAEALFQRLRHLSFGRLCAALQHDVQPFSDPEARPFATRLERFYKQADHRADWWKFFWPEPPLLEMAWQPGGHVARVHFSTRECRHAHALLAPRRLRLFANDPLAIPPPTAVSAQVYVNENDVLAGATTQRLQAALDHIVADHRPDCVHLMTTCLPELIGDHPGPLLQGLRERFGVATLWSAKTRGPGADLNGRLADEIERIPFAAERDPGSVIVAGLEPGPDRQEVERLLTLLGLRVAGHVVPRWDLSAVPGVERTSALLWANPVGWQRLANAPFERRWRVVRSAPPFGLQGSVAWLTRVADTLGCDPNPPGWQSWHDACEAELAPLRRAAARHRIALIGDPADLNSLVRDRAAFGFSVAWLLGEIGFTVRCLVYTGNGAADWSQSDRPLAAGRLEFASFATQQQLDAHLADGIDLAFSHFNDDARLAPHGIAGFCEGSFGLGPAGLLRAGQCLLAACRCRPFAAQRRFLRNGRT